jgi:hypothetical protein
VSERFSSSLLKIVTWAPSALPEAMVVALRLTRSSSPVEEVVEYDAEDSVEEEREEREEKDEVVGSVLTPEPL